MKEDKWCLWISGILSLMKQKNHLHARRGGREEEMKCPRCGATMTGGICNNCGFPMNRRRIAGAIIVPNIYRIERVKKHSI